MTGLDEIPAVSGGAKFFGADMHVHSCGGSRDVRDTDELGDSLAAMMGQERRQAGRAPNVVR